MKIVVMHPHGNQNTNKLVSKLCQSNLLDTFWTCLAFPFNFYVFKKRFFCGVKFSKIRINFLKEIFRQVCIIFKLKNFYIKDENKFSVNSIYKDLDLKVLNYLKKNKTKIDAVYSYEDCSLNSFKFAKKSGLTTIYDLTSPYWYVKKKILDHELVIHPEWKLSSTEILNKKKIINKNQELFLSDQVIVASTFSAKSLNFYKKKKLNIETISYGVKNLNVKKIFQRKTNEKLKIIFVGRPILSKGIHYLIEVLSGLDFPWQLEIFGSIPEKPDQISKKLLLFLQNSNCKCYGNISNPKLLDRMRNSHVMIFPSLYEGFGQVILESLACGLPIITTENTGAPDIIVNGKNGFITPIRDIKFTRKILYQLYLDEKFRCNIAENSLVTAKKKPWSLYQNKILFFLTQLNKTV